MMQCPSCTSVFDIMEPGELSIGVDDFGIYMQHSCGHKGRPGDRPPVDPPSTGIRGWCLCGHHELAHWCDGRKCAAGPPCYCGLFVQRDVPMPGPRRPDGDH